MRRELRLVDIRHLLSAALVREGVAAFAQRAGVSQTYLRTLGEGAPNDAVLAALGVEKVVGYRLVTTPLPEIGSA